MKGAVGVLLLASLLCPAGLPAKEVADQRRETGEELKLSNEDRQVILMLELLEIMELLRDLEILEGAQTGAPEEKQ